MTCCYFLFLNWRFSLKVFNIFDMTKKEVLIVLNNLKAAVEEFNTIKFESTPRHKELQERIFSLYGSVKKYYTEASGTVIIEVPVVGSNLYSIYNNYFEAGYLSGRTFYSHQGYAELLTVLAEINNDDVKNESLRGSILYKKPNWAVVMPLFLSVIAGSFFLGKYFGENRFDIEKIQMNKEIDLLKQDTIILKHSLTNVKDSLKTMRNRKIEDNSIKEK